MTNGAGNAGNASGNGGATATAGSGGEGGSSVGGAAGMGGGGGAAPLKAPFDWVGVIGTGQSLSVGVAAGVLDDTQPYNNLKLKDSGPDPKYPLSGGAPQWSLVPLTELIRAKVPGTGPGYDDGQYPNNIAGETPHSGLSNTLSWLWKQRGDAGEYITTTSVVGWSGKCLVNIDKAGGKRAYPASLSEAKVFKSLANKQNKTFGYGAITMTHGECDATTVGYGEGLYKLLQDYNADLKAITGQTRDVVMLVSQQSTKPTGATGSAAQVFNASLAHPGELICTGPKYQYQYAPDKLHLQAAGYRRLGEKYAQVFDAVVNRGVPWKPLGPISAKRNGSTIEVAFAVPEPPLVWSKHIAAAHQTVHTEWAKGRGFEVTTSGGAPVTIDNVTIQNESVIITLKDAPAGALVVSYALTQDGDLNQGGDILGLRGQLRDSDPFVGPDTETIKIKATQGDAKITSVDAGAFRRRTGFDVLSEDGKQLAVVVKSRDSDDQLTLSGNWPGTTGEHTLVFHYDLYNYAVHFSMAVE